MDTKIKIMIDSNPDYKRYLRTNSYWYKTLNRNPLMIDNFIREVKEIIRKHLAPNAGFMKFCPSPPKSCLTTIIANTHPTISKPTFNVDGIFNAIRRPVTAALKSVTVTFLCMKY